MLLTSWRCKDDHDGMDWKRDRRYLTSQTSNGHCGRGVLQAGFPGLPFWPHLSITKHQTVQHHSWQRGLEKDVKWTRRGSGNIVWSMCTFVCGVQWVCGVGCYVWCVVVCVWCVWCYAEVEIVVCPRTFSEQLQVLSVQVFPCAANLSDQIYRACLQDTCLCDHAGF